jgi:TetR/AcrR family transcriptional repressor of nem operon
MRYPSGHKEKTRARILEAASKVFRRNGYHASGVDSVMEAAGLTAGGFYAHFDSKESLLAQTLEDSAGHSADREPFEFGDKAGPEWVEAFLEYYLSKSHTSAIEHGCPLAALVSEVSRSDDRVKRAFETALRELGSRVAFHLDAGGSRSPDVRALAIVAMCVGGLGLARSVEDEALVEKILDSCRRVARHLLTTEIET